MNVIKNIKSPSWTRDELILALNLYFKHKPTSINKNHPEIIKLSKQLNELSVNLEKTGMNKFRNTNSVYMKLCNFLKYDPTYKGVGLKQGNKLEQIVWDRFSNNRKDLVNTANIITNHIGTVIIGESSEEEDEFPEGKVMYRIHKIRERNTAEIRKLKSQREQEGNLICEVCEFDFYKNYGDIGKGYIECHHNVPLSYYIEQNVRTKLSDLKLVCSNCHRILHRRRPWMTVESLREVIKNLWTT